ncbi:hypothetical protein V8C26DRAFT_412364 [Trichoderma gracile]
MALHQVSYTNFLLHLACEHENTAQNICIASKPLLPPVMISFPSPRHCKVLALMLQVIRVPRTQIQHPRPRCPKLSLTPFPSSPPLYPNSSMQASSTEPNMPCPLTESLSLPSHLTRSCGKGMDGQKRGQLRCMHQPAASPPSPSLVLSFSSRLP